jgi:hypothetical protein
LSSPPGIVRIIMQQEKREKRGEEKREEKTFDFLAFFR